MKALEVPSYSYEDILSECQNGITGNNILRDKLSAALPSLISNGEDYQEKGKKGTLFEYTALNVVTHTDPKVVNDLTYSDMRKLYSEYFRKKEKPARKIYDAIKTQNEKCPLCGEIGFTKSIDHYLPQSKFSQFSVLLHNLIPACRDCNEGEKLESYALRAEDQLIHPYLDNRRFFNEQWVFATYDPKTISVLYYVDPPSNWSEIDKKRVFHHFDKLDLAYRYRLKAAELLSITLGQIQSMRNDGSPSDAIEHKLISHGIKQPSFINHWMRVMFQALTNALHSGDV